MLACQGKTVATEEHILDVQLIASGFHAADATEALSLLLSGTVLSAAGYGKGRLNRETFHGQVPDAYDATRDELQLMVPGLSLVGRTRGGLPHHLRRAYR